MKRIEKDIAISDLLYQSLYGKLSEDEQTMLDCWLKDEAHRELYLSLKKPDELYEEVQEMAEMDTGLYYRKLQRKIYHRRQWRIVAAVSGIAAVLGLAVGWYEPFFGKQKQAEPAFIVVQQLPEDQTMLQTEEGKTYYIDDTVKKLHTEEVEGEKLAGVEYRQATKQGLKVPAYNVLATSSRGTIEVTLADSSRVWLNAGSRLRYPNEFKADRRVVELVGEAYFEVTHREQMPFIVKAGRNEIEVLGTQFNVNTAGNESCTTTLVQGCVKVRNDRKDSVIIQPGQQVKSSRDGKITVKTVSPRFYTAWKENRFAFQGAPLYRIMEELAEWYDFTYEFSTPRLANLRFTTIVPRYPEVGEVLDILKTTEEFSVVRISNNHIRIKRFERDSSR